VPDAPTPTVPTKLCVIIAASTDVDVSFVMAMQTVRLLVVLFAAPLLTRLIAERIGGTRSG